jgi:hypothetical protein
MIPGILIALLTFPGVIVHESAHLLFCRLRRVAVFDACFLRVGNPLGYVVHERVTDFVTLWLVSAGPFLVNSVACILLCLPASVPMKIFGTRTCCRTSCCGWDSPLGCTLSRRPATQITSGPRPRKQLTVVTSWPSSRFPWW